MRASRGLNYLQDKPGADIVFHLLEEAKNNEAKLLMTWANAGEVYYRVWLFFEMW